jgi:ATP-dependent Clp protease ATP-binding subunit ClpC
VAVQELESELHQLRREQDYVAARKQYDQAAELGKRIEAKEAELKKLVEDWERSGPPAVPRSRRNTWRRLSRA